jgi:hypothetical protein
LNPENFGNSILLFASCGETRLLVSLCVGDRCGMVGSDEDRGRSRRLGADDWGWLSIGRVLSDRMIKRSDDAVCGLHHTQGDEEREFFGLASKPRSTGFLVWPQTKVDEFPSLGLKTGSYGLVI